MAIEIRKAERRRSRLRIGLTGASGSGKTRSALEIALGLGGEVGMIDTESGRGEMYAGSNSIHETETPYMDYSVVRLDAPFTPKRYIEALDALVKHGCTTVIIDSMSHAWNGTGGVLEMVDATEGDRGGKFASGWKKASPQHNAFVDAIVRCPANLICTFRSQTEYAMRVGNNGKPSPVKIGLKPVQREGFEYEFMVFASLDFDHLAHITKDNTETLDREPFAVTPDTGRKLAAWMESLPAPLSRDEDFVRNVLPRIREELFMCETEADLRTAYGTHFRKLSAENPAFLPMLNEIKDACKKSSVQHTRGMQS